MYIYIYTVYTYTTQWSNIFFEVSPLCARSCLSGWSSGGETYSPKHRNLRNPLVLSHSELENPPFFNSVNQLFLWSFSSLLCSITRGYLGPKNQPKKQNVQEIPQLLCFAWSPPWHIVLTFFPACIWHILWHSTWHSIWHIFWHSILSGILSICHTVCSDILSGILSNMSSRPGALHSIQSWWYRVRVQASPTASGAARGGERRRRRKVLHFC